MKVNLHIERTLSTLVGTFCSQDDLWRCVVIDDGFRKDDLLCPASLNFIVHASQKARVVTNVTLSGFV
jgi:hypothetical protein